jgi:hypothetical protein
MYKTCELRWHLLLVSLLLVVVSLCAVLVSQPSDAQTFTGMTGERDRITLGFQVKPEAVQALMPAPWQLVPLNGGPLKGANFLVSFINRIREDDPEGKPRYSGNNPFVVFVAPAKHPQTGQAVGVILEGLASNPAGVPGYYKVYRPATVRVEHASKSHEVDAEEVTDVWEVRDGAGSGRVELRLQALVNVRARARDKGEPENISAKDPALWRIYKFDAATDVVKSVPQGIDRVKGYTFRLTVPEYRKLFDGSEKLIGITLLPWYVRETFVR